MKNTIIICLGIISFMLVSNLFINKEETDIVINNYDDAKVFQLGAYSSEENAKETINKYGGIIINEKNMFYVYYAILKDSSNIERMIKYLDDNNINYYIKDINISDDFDQELYKYEILLKDTKTNLAFIKLNTKLIELYRSEYETKRSTSE